MSRLLSRLDPIEFLADGAIGLSNRILFLAEIAYAANVAPAWTTASPRPDFALPDTDGKIRALDEFAASPALLIAFICNHCPFVLHVLDQLLRLCPRISAEGACKWWRSRRTGPTTIPRTTIRTCRPSRANAACPSPISTTRARTSRWPITRSAPPISSSTGRPHAVLRRAVRCQPPQDRPPADARHAAPAHRPAGHRRGPARRDRRLAGRPARAAAAAPQRRLLDQVAAGQGPVMGIVSRLWVPSAAVVPQERGPDYLGAVDGADWSEGLGFHRGFFSSFRVEAGQGRVVPLPAADPGRAGRQAAVPRRSVSCCGKCLDGARIGWIVRPARRDGADRN